MSQLRARYLAADARGAPAERRDLRPEVVALLHRAEEAAATELQARLAQMLGVLDTSLGEFATAAQWLEKAFFLADAAGDHGLAFDSALGRAMVSGPFVGDPDDAWKWVRHARATNERLGDPLRATQLLLLEGDLHMGAADFAAARDVLERARALMPEDAPDWLVVSLYGSLGQLLAQDDDDGPCREAYGQAIDRARTYMGPTHADLIRPLMGIATCEMEPGLYPSAQAHLEEAIALAQQHGHELAEVFARGNLGLMLRNLQQPTGALREAVATRDGMVRLFGDDGIRVARANTNLAAAYADVGRFAEATETARAAIRFYDSQETPSSMRYGTDLTLTWARLELGDEDLVPDLERLVAEAPSDTYRIEATITLAQAYLAQGRVDDVVRLLAPVYPLDAELPPMSSQRFAEGRWLYARALAAKGESAPAAEQRLAALKLSREHDDDPRGIAERIAASPT